MPISNGANHWPNSYWHKPTKKQPNTKLVVVSRSPSPSPSIRRPPSLPEPELDDDEFYEPSIRRTPTPQRVIIHETTPPPEPDIYYTRVTSPRPRPPSPTIVKPRSPTQVVVQQYQPPYRGYQQPPPYHDRPYDDGCCGRQYFSSDANESNAGCCQGGLSKRNYPYNYESMNYGLKGTGVRRCCAIVWGVIIGLLLLGLLIGLLAGLMPALTTKNNQAAVASKYPNGYWLNGIYYYQITNPADVFYFAMGPGIPCNPNNNNVMPVNTVGTIAATFSSQKVTVAVTGAFQSTIPNCNSVTSSYILANGISVSTTTVNPYLLLSNGIQLRPLHCLALVIVAVLPNFGLF